MIPPMQTVLQIHEVHSHSANTSVQGQGHDMGIYIALLGDDQYVHPQERFENRNTSH